MWALRWWWQSFPCRLRFLHTSAPVWSNYTRPPMSLLQQWKGWSHLFRSTLFLKSWLANFEQLQVIDLMEKVTKEQSKEATKSNGSFLGSWSWVIEPMIEGGFIRFLMTSQNKMVGISCQFKSFVVMSSVRLSEIWILMVHNARKLHIWTLNYHMLVFGHCVFLNLSMCIWKEYCEAAHNVWGPDQV